MFFDDTLQNTKRYRWCDDGFGHRKRKEKLWKLWKEHSWKVEVVVCNVYKKVKQLVDGVVDEVMRVEDNVYKGFEVDEFLDKL